MKTEVHVQLLMAMKQSQARIVSNEGHLRLLIATDHQDVFE
jgi:hypothetical protein